MTRSEGTFQQVNVGWWVYEQVAYHDVFTVKKHFFLFKVSFVNKFATTEGGTHVDYVANQIVAGVVRICRKHFQVEESEVKRHLWVFVNAVIDKPSFNSPIRGALTTPQESFGSSCELSGQFLSNGM